MKFLYLIQSEKNSHYWEPFASANRTIMLGVWGQEPQKNQIDLRGTTITTGRNKLFSFIVENNLLDEYNYVSFCDDDIEFERGSFDEYENTIKKTSEILYHTTYFDPLDKNGWKWHTDQSEKSEGIIWKTDTIDTCFFTVKSSHLTNVFPFYPTFDNKHLWVACEIFRTVVKNKNLLWSISSNVFVKNNDHRNYVKSEGYEHYHKKVDNFLKQIIHKNYLKCQHLVI